MKLHMTTNQLSPKNRAGSAFGFSLVELMVAAALLSGLALAFATLMSNSAKSQKGLNEAQAVQEIVNTINLVLNRTDSCASAFPKISESTFQSSSVSNPISLNELHLPGGNTVILQANQTLPGIASLQVPASGISLTNLGPLKDLTGKDLTQVRRNDKGNPITYNLYAAKLSVTIEKVSPTAATASLGTPAYIRPFTMTLGFEREKDLAFCNQETSAAQECQNTLGGVYYDGKNAPRCHLPGVVSDNSFDIKTTPIGETIPQSKLTITQDGKVGIGTTTPQTLLETQGTIRSTLLDTGPAVQFYLNNNPFGGIYIEKFGGKTELRGKNYLNLGLGDHTTPPHVRMSSTGIELFGNVTINGELTVSKQVTAQQSLLVGSTLKSGGAITALGQITGTRVVATAAVTTPGYTPPGSSPATTGSGTSLNCPEKSGQVVTSIIAGDCKYAHLPSSGSSASASAVQCSDATPIMSGINADGSPICKSVSVIASSSCVASCPAGQVLQGIQKGCTPTCVTMTGGTAGTPGKDGAAGTPGGVGIGGYPPNKTAEVILEWTNSGKTWRKIIRAMTDNSGLPYMSKTTNGTLGYFVVSEESPRFSEWIQTTQIPFGVNANVTVNPVRGLILYGGGGVDDLAKEWYGPTVHCIPAHCVAPWK